MNHVSSSTEHESFVCDHCGERRTWMPADLFAPVLEIILRGRQFANEHAGCKKTTGAVRELVGSTS